MLCSPVIAQEITSETILQISLKGKEYNSLSLACMIMNDIGLVRGWEHIKGKKTDMYGWQFIIPDSIYKDAFTMKIHEFKKDSTVQFIVFRFFDKNTLESWATPDFIPDKGYCKIEAEYVETINYGKQRRISDNKLLHDLFLYKEVNDNKKFLSTVGQLKQKTDLYKLSYEERLSKSINLFGENPTSPMYIAMLYSELGSYRTKEDIQSLFDCFSDSLKQQTIYGKKIQEYLSFSEFPNEKLLLVNSDKQEDIIKDTTKYNLVLFSASWCAPCHKQIPELKRMYGDLKNKIDFTYISIDDKTSKDQWRRLLQKEGIPWRSLAIKDEDIQRIRDKYFVQGVPLAYLIYHDGHFEKIDIREKEDNEKLYKLLEAEKVIE